MTNDPIIRIGDIRQAGFCVKGARTWFTRHGLDFKQFLRFGMPASELIAKGDGLAQKVVEAKRARDGR